MGKPLQQHKNFAPKIFPIQFSEKIFLSEQERALDLITEGARPTRSLADGLQCDCPFFQKKKKKWQLPCADLWIHEKFVDGVYKIISWIDMPSCLAKIDLKSMKGWKRREIFQ